MYIILVRCIFIVIELLILHFKSYILHWFILYNHHIENGGKNKRIRNSNK